MEDPEEDSEVTAVLDTDELLIREISEGCDSLILEESDVEIVPIEPDCLAILSGQVEESLKDGTQDETVDRTKDESVNITKPIRVEQTKETLRQKGIMEFFPKKNN